MTFFNSSYKNFAKIVAVLTAVITLLVMAAWIVDITFLLNLGFIGASMKFNTALLFFLISLILLLLIKDKKYEKLIFSLNSLVILIAGLTLLEYIYNINLGVDNLIIADQISTTYPGRMSIATAMNFLFISIAIFGITARNYTLIKIGQDLLLVSALIALLSLNTFILEIPSVEKMLVDTMALHTSVLFIAIPVALSLKNSHIGFTGLVIGSLPGSRSIRFLLAFILFTPLILSFALVTISNNYEVSRDFILALHTTIIVVLFIAYISYVAVKLNETALARQQLEHELEQTYNELKNHWRSLVENTPDLIARIDKDRRYLYVNEKVTSEKLGIDASFLKGKSPKELGYPDENVKRYYEGLDKAFAGESISYFTDAQTPNGNIILYTILAPEYDEAGEIQTVLSISRDVTHLKKVEEELLETKNFLESLVTHIPDGIARFDDQGHVLYLNDIKAKKWGLQKSQALGRKIEDLDIAGAKEKAASLQSALKHKKMQELYLKVSDDDYRHLLVVPEMVDNGSKPTVLMISRDATSLYKKQIDLERSELRYRTIYENVPMTIIRLSPEYRYESINPAIKKNLGMEPDELIGKTIYEAGLSEETLAKFEDNLKVAGEIKDVVSFEISYGYKDRNRHVVVDIVPEVDKRNEIQSFLVLSTDLTTLKVHELKLENQKTQLEHVNEELEAFTYTVSHDLRSPLRAIVGFNEKLKRSLGDKVDDREKRYIEKIDTNARRMALLIDELLHFSRLDKIEISKQPIKLAPLIREILFELQENTTKNIQLQLEENLPLLYADRNLFRQVLQNLITNSIKYSKKDEGVFFSVSATETPDFVTFKFCDQGIGFDQRYSKRIFEVFHRLHTLEEYSGVGVGLSIAERIVNKHSGEIWATGKENEGACFFIKLPKE